MIKQMFVNIPNLFVKKVFFYTYYEMSATDFLHVSEFVREDSADGYNNFSVSENLPALR